MPNALLFHQAYDASIICCRSRRVLYDSAALGRSPGQLEDLAPKKEKASAPSRDNEFWKVDDEF